MSERGGFLGLGRVDDWIWVIIAIVVIIWLCNSNSGCCKRDYDYKS